VSVQADPGYSLTSERLRRRKVVNVAMEVVATVAALLAVAVLAIVVISVLKKGIGAINVDFFTQNTVTSSFSFGEPPASGIKNAIIGSLEIVLFAVLMALPVGILAAIYLNEFAVAARARAAPGRARRLNGIPAIVVGIFVFVLLVATAAASRR
jgi:phosphate transport system permease protein